VVYKRARYYEPLDPRPIPKTAWALFNEWAALEFLDQLALTRPVSPRFIGGDADEGVIAMQSLGEAPSLADLLQGSDAGVAAAACIALSRALARMHQATVGREQEYNSIRDALGPGGRHALYQDCARQIDVFRTVCRRAKISLDRAETDLHDVLTAMESPNPRYFGLLHGDVGPGNEKLVDGEQVLIDFEVAGFGHTLREAVAARLVFTEGDNSAALPPELVDRMETAYLAECADAHDWQREYALCASFHVVGEVGWEISTNGVNWRAAHRCRVLLELLEESGQLLRLRDAIHALAASLPNPPPPAYPAFS
jgi:tRNA A-37 threonylcarbamoyl transferase component Bud32